MKKIQLLLLVIIGLSLGCSQIKETPKIIWGSSIASLERARDKAISKTYLCEMDECFDAVLSLDRKKALESQSLTPSKTAFNVFIQDRVEGHIVVLGIKGNVDTTKVAIFLDTMGPRTTRLEISSLSTTAKEKVAMAVFAELNKRFSEKL